MLSSGYLCQCPVSFVVILKEASSITCCLECGMKTWEHTATNFLQTTLEMLTCRWITASHTLNELQSDELFSKCKLQYSLQVYYNKVTQTSSMAQVNALSTLVGI